MGTEQFSRVAVGDKTGAQAIQVAAVLVVVHNAVKEHLNGSTVPY